jgi:drug/metabolite transporter (DMT)-like permease
MVFLVGLTSYKKNFKRVNKSDVLSILFIGVIGVFINQRSFFRGLQTADPTTSAIILAMTPILTGLLVALFLKGKLTIRMLLGSILAIIGIYCAVVIGGGSSLHFDKGLMWIVVTMITFAIMIIMTRVLSQRIDPFTITLCSNLVGFIVSIPFAFSLDTPLRMSSNMTVWALLIGTAVVVHGIATLIWNNNIRHVDASKASVLSNLE